MPGITNAQLAQKINELIVYYDTREVELDDWMNGTVGGGPNTNGTYPLTDRSGVVTWVRSPAQLESDVDSLVAGAAGHASDADAAKIAALAAQAAAEAARDLALGYRDSALGAVTTSGSNATAAANSATNSNASMVKAGQWAEEAEDVEVETGQYSALHWAAKAAADAVLTAADVASSAASASAASASASAAAASAAAAATFDPANFYLRTALDAGQLDTRYYTESEVDALLAGLSSDHGALTGLGDDDHTQYHNDARGDARYSLLSHAHAASAITAGNFPTGVFRFVTPGGTQITSDPDELSGLQIYQTAAGDDALMTFHVAGDFAAHFGLDGGVNDFVVGGWSMNATYRLLHEGNLSTLLTGAATGVSGDWTFNTYSIDARYGLSGGYSDAGGGTAFGATIWSLDNSWVGTVAGTNGGVPSYGISWVRGTHASAINSGEGLYIYSASAQQAAITTTGVYFAQEVYPSGQTVGNLTSIGAVGGTYGSLGVSGAQSGGYSGINVGGRLVLMNNGSTTSGLYNDTNNHWFVLCIENSETYLYTAGTQIARTDATGMLRVGAGNFLYHASDYGDGRLTISTSAASGGSNGDIWFRY